MAKPLSLVTGSTRGIGEAIAHGLVRDGFHVIVTGRDASRGEKVVRDLGGEENASFAALDVTQPDAIDAMAKRIEKDGGLDVLINNAGASFNGFDAAIARKTLDVNFVGMMRLTERLLPLMRSGARIVMVSSGMGEVSSLSAALQKEVLHPSLDREKLIAFADRFVADIAAKTHTKNGWPSNAYRVSKIVMNGYVRILARDLARDASDARNIKVNAADPGWVRTDMGGSHAPRSVERGAATPIFLAKLGTEGPNGGFFRDEMPIAW